VSDRSGSGTSRPFELFRELDALRASLADKRDAREGEQLARNRDELAAIRAHLKRMSRQLEERVDAAP
jgi:hypothetical protein